MCAFDIRELQLTELDILIEIDRICRTHRIRVSKKELKEPYFLQNHNTDKNHRLLKKETEVCMRSFWWTLNTITMKSEG